jgi:predicted SAM-dependent methyltransferase
MQAMAEHILKSTRLNVPIRGLVNDFRRIKGIVTGRTIAARYLAAHPVRKLHIGCGSSLLSSWLNSDYLPRSDQVMALDATRKFPFPGGTFDRVYSEHMIEHVSFQSGLSMLIESQRVLKSGGRIRIVTPNLEFLIDLYKEDRSPLQTAYIKWATDAFVRGAPYVAPVFVINNFVRDWGHLFIYDEKALRSSLERAGFVGVITCQLNESQDEYFRSLEHEERMPPGFLSLESMVLEGTKP